MEECVRFAREAGYRKVTLWTNSVLLAARHIYAAAGFQLVHSEPDDSFGHDLVAETWEPSPGITRNGPWAPAGIRVALTPGRGGEGLRGGGSSPFVFDIPPGGPG